jgi:hypothetical protein
MKANKGVTSIVLGIVVALIMLAVVIPIGMAVWQASGTAVFSAPDGDSTAQYNTTYSIYTTTNTNVGSGFSLIAIAPIVLAAGGIIALLVVGFMKFRA